MLNWHSIYGTVSRVSTGLIDELFVTANEFVDCDVARLSRTADGVFIICGRPQTLKRHGAVKVGALVQILVRPAWSHVSIDQGKPIVWVEPT